MATRVDFSGVFDTVLPNAYIKKVSLLPASVIGRKRAVNYDESKVYHIRKNAYGVAKVQTPAIDPSGISFEPRGLTVEAEIVLKDRVLPTGKSYWFDDDNLLRRMKLRVVLCRDPELTKNFLERNFTPEYMKELREQNLFVEHIIDISKNMHSKITEQRKEMIGGRKTYSISYPVLFNIPNLRPKNLSIFAHTEK